MTSSSPAHALGETPGDIPRGQSDSSSHEISAEMVGKSSMAQELSQESSMILDASLSSEEHIEGDVKGPVPLPSTTTTTTSSGSDEATTTATTSASSETTGSVSVTTSQPSRPAQIRASDSQGSSSPSINNLVPQASSSISQSVSTDGREPQVANEKKTTPFVDPATSSTTTSLSSTSSSNTSSGSSSDRPLSQASSSSNKKQINTTTTTSLHVPFTNSTSGTSATRTTTTTTTTTTQHTFPSTLPPSATLLAPTPSVPTVRRWFSDIIDVMAERCVPVAAAGANGEPLALHPGKPWIENASVLLTSLPCPEAATFQRMICSPLTDLEYEKELLGASARPLHRQGNIYAGLLYVTDANIPRNAFDGFSRHKPTATSTQASFRGSSALSVRGRITTILVEHKIYSQASGQHWSTCRLTRLVLKATIQPSSKGNGLAKQRTLFHYYLSCGKHQPVSLLETLKAHKATHGIPLRNYNRPSQTEDIEAALQLTALCSPNVTLVARPLSSSSSSTSSVPAAPSAPSSAQFAPSTTTTTESALRPASSTASSLPTTTGSSTPPPPPSSPPSASSVSPALSPSSSDSIAISAPPPASVNATMSDAPSAQEDSVPAVTPTSSVSPKSSSILASSSPSSSDATPPQPPPMASNSTLPATAFNAPSPSYSVSPPSSSSSALSSSSPPVSATAVVPASPAPKRTASQANCVASPIVTKAANTSIPPSEPSSFIQPAQIEGNLLLSLGRRSPSSVTTTHQHQV